MGNAVTPSNPSTDKRFDPSAWRNRARRYVVYGGVFLSIVLTLAIAVAAIDQLRDMARQRAILSTQNLASSATLTFDSIIDTIDGALLSAKDEIEEQVASRSKFKQSISEFLAQQQSHLPVVSFVRATNEFGDVIEGAGIKTPYIRIADRDYFSRQRDNPNAGLVVGTPIFSRINHRWAWVFSRRINKPDGSFGGVVYATLLIDGIDRVLMQIKLVEGQSITLRHADLALIASRDETKHEQLEDIGNRAVSTEFASALRSNPDEGNFTEASRTMSYRRSGRHEFLITVGIPDTAIFSEWQRQLRVTSITVATLIAVNLTLLLLVRRAWLRQTRDLAALNEVQELASLASYEINLQTGDIKVSRNMYAVLGIEPRHAMTVDNWIALIPEPPRSEIRNYFNHIVANRLPFIREYPIIRRDNGEQRWMFSKGQLHMGSSGQPIALMGTLQDISERKRAEDEIKNLAYFDSLTALPNRRHLIDSLKHELAQNSRRTSTSALLLIDLDNFKSLNDTRGHDVGDLLLKEVAHRLSRCTREADIVARLGGDEFVVVLTELNEHPHNAAMAVEMICEKILAELNRPYALSGHTYHNTCSIGVALFAGPRQSVDELMKRADMAMYQAKAAGRNAVRFFDPEMQAAVSARVSMENDLRQAVELGQFVLHFQPQLDLQGRVIGAEALVRWQHPVKGLVAPAEFIPLAESTDLILPLGEWVLRTAYSHLLAWSYQPKMTGLTLAVNVSARQFSAPGFVDQVKAVIELAPPLSARLKLELTEGLLLEDAEAVISRMVHLKSAGVGFSMDDFGTGYSSLSYLKRLPLDQLKIDQSFVRDVLTDPNDAVISKTIIALGQTLGLNVIAEGVESLEQRDFLAQAGCHCYQGYFFSKPLPIAEFESYVRRQNAANI
ncbi:MAG: EAL domain-containing protein [Burkholderiaceae bacterium]|nr:EAL domain-containing protein [Burkholderiaceae bacterium]